MSKATHQHHEAKHVKTSEGVRDFVIGMADGLTVPFALVAGLSGVLDSTNIIVTAGVAEIAAGSIAMGLGGYLAAKTQRQHYNSEVQRELYEIKHFPDVEAKEVEEILEQFGVSSAQSVLITNELKKDHKKWLDFMMRFELGLEKPNKNREIVSPLIIGSAYILGGIIPLFPYVIMHNIESAFNFSIAITGSALFAFGWLKGAFTGTSKIKSALHTCIIGGLAASVAYYIAKLIT